MVVRLSLYYVMQKETGGERIKAEFLGHSNYVRKLSNVHLYRIGIRSLLIIYWTTKLKGRLLLFISSQFGLQAKG